MAMPLESLSSRIMVIYQAKRRLRSGELQAALAHQYGYGYAAQSVRKTLSDLTDIGLLVRVSPGFYALPDAVLAFPHALPQWVENTILSAKPRMFTPQELRALHFQQFGYRLISDTLADILGRLVNSDRVVALRLNSKGPRRFAYYAK